MKKIFSALSFLLIASLQLALAQSNVISVNNFTGTANVAIPLYNVKSGSLSAPVSLIYSGTGVKVKDIEGNAGMNWQLSAGGKIVRQVRGLPDDCKKNPQGEARLGWLYNNNGAKINNFNIANDNNSATFADESTDANYLQANFSDLSDTEPDLFYVNAPGLSCQLVFDNNHVIRTIPYQDIKVSYAQDTAGRIASFTIVNDQGVTYEFARTEETMKYATIPKNSGADKYDTTIVFLNRDRHQYKSIEKFNTQTKGITFNSAWHLTQMTNLQGSFLRFTYEALGNFYFDLNSNQQITDNVYSADPIRLVIGGPSGSVKTANPHTVISKTIPVFITQIFYGNRNMATEHKALEFNFGGSGSNLPIVTSITGYGKTLNFNYTEVASSRDVEGVSYLFHKNNMYLLSIGYSATGCNDATGYRFNYKNVNYIYKDLRYQYTVPIPDSSSKKIDYWGYYKGGKDATSLIPLIYVNPNNTALERYRYFATGNASASYPYQLTGSDRSANPDSIDAGSLTKITYPTGGYSLLTYESNDFYDNTAGTVIQGGGIRIKQIADYESDSPSPMVRTFAYINPETGKSSGKPVSLPVYAFTVPYIGTVNSSDSWNYATVRSEDNLSSEDNSIFYSHVRESRPGAGSTLYEYNTPATNWDNSAAPDWSPTINYTARLTNVATGFVTNSKNTYPFALNTNFDFERGLLKKVTNYNENSKEVSESNYTYVRSGTPLIVTGLRYDTLANTVAYAKYQILTSVGKLQSAVTEKVFDQPTLTQISTTTVNSYYNSLNHRYMTDQQTTNSDGSISRSHTTYSKDLQVAAGATDPASIALYNLALLNLNIPVEKYMQVERNGINKTVGAQLIKFAAFTPAGGGTQYLPLQSLVLSAGVGLTDFKPAAINNNVFSYDASRYIIAANYLAYDHAGSLLSQDDNNYNTKSVITDHQLDVPVASIAGANYNEIGFSDFNQEKSGELPSPVVFNYSSANTLSTNSRSGKYALSLQAGSPLTKVLIKNANAKNYIYSVWINATAPGTITLNLINGNSQATANYTLAYGNTNGAYKYYELKVPMTGLSGNMTASFQSNTAILIDDVLFYPEMATVNTVAYDAVTQLKTSETNSSGISNYYAYDSAGRLNYIYDQDKQIVKKNSYLGGNCNLYFQTNLQFTYPTLRDGNDLIVGNGYTGKPVLFEIKKFTAPTSNNLVFIFDYGDGSAQETSSSYNFSHTYKEPGDYTVTLTAISPVYGRASVSSTLFKIAPSKIPIRYYNNLPDITKGYINSISFTDPIGGGLINYTETDLKNGNVLLDRGYTYNVIISIGAKGTPAWKSLQIDMGFPEPGCISRIAGQTTYNVTWDTRNISYINLFLNNTTCPLQ